MSREENFLRIYGGSGYTPEGYRRVTRQEGEEYMQRTGEKLELCGNGCHGYWYNVPVSVKEEK